MLTRSQQLLLRLAPLFRAEDFDAASHELLRSVGSDDEWRELTHEAGRHRLLGYVSHAANGESRLPPLACDQAWRILDGTRIRFAYHRAHLEEVASILKDVPFRLLKGYSVALRAHPIPYLRPCGDVDLLVPSRSLLTSLTRLTEHGFRVTSPSYFPWPPPVWFKNPKFSIELDEIVLRRDDLVTEIHSQLVSYKLFHAVDIDEVFAQPERITMPDTTSELSTLNSEDAWLHLLINHHMHRFSGGLGSLLDIAKWEDLYPLNLDSLNDKIDRWRIRYLLLPVLTQLKFVFPDLPSASELVTALPPEPAIFSAAYKARSTTCTPLYWIRKSPRPFKTLLRNVFPPRTQAALRYGRDPLDPKLWGNRMLRPFVLLGRHAGTASREINRR